MPIFRWFIRTVLCAAAAAGFLLIPACQPSLPLLEKVKQQGELVVATQLGPTMYYQELDRTTGFEYELAKAFADFLGVKLTIRTYSDLGEMLNDVRHGKIHIAAAGLTITPERSKNLRFSSPYQQVTQELVYHSDQKPPRTIEALYDKKLVVIANSSHSENLQQMKLEHPKLNWEAKSNVSALALLNMVNDGQADYVVMDSNVFLAYRDVFPELRRAMTLTDPEPLAWAFSAVEDGSLFTMAELFLIRLTNPVNWKNCWFAFLAIVSLITWVPEPFWPTWIHAWFATKMNSNPKPKISISTGAYWQPLVIRNPFGTPTPSRPRVCAA